MKPSELLPILVLLLQVKDTVSQDVNSTNSHCCGLVANYSIFLFPHVQNISDNDNSLYYLPYMVIVRLQKVMSIRPSRGLLRNKPLIIFSYCYY